MEVIMKEYLDLESDINMTANEETSSAISWAFNFFYDFCEFCIDNHILF